MNNLRKDKRVNSVMFSAHDSYQRLVEETDNWTVINSESKDISEYGINRYGFEIKLKISEDNENFQKTIESLLRENNFPNPDFEVTASIKDYKTNNSLYQLYFGGPQ